MIKGVFSVGDRPEDSALADLSIGRGLVIGVGEQGEEEEHVSGVSIRLVLSNDRRCVIVLAPDDAAALAMAIVDMVVTMPGDESRVAVGES